MAILPSSGNEEALLQAFHPNGPLAVHLNTYGSPAYVFPLWRLPPRVVRAICFLKSEAQQLGAGLHPGTSQRVNVGGIKFARELCSQWFALLGPERLNSLPGGDVEGLVLTPQEFTLTCLVHYIGSTDQQLAGLMPTRQPSSLGGWTQPGLVVGCRTVPNWWFRQYRIWRIFWKSQHRWNVMAKRYDPREARWNQCCI